MVNYDLYSDIFLLGRRDDISDLLNISDYFVLSSKYEGLPTVVIEAMACKTLVISTDCGGSAEIMADTGLLVRPSDSTALANAMSKALNMSHAELISNNNSARQLIESKFSLESSVKNWLKLYES